MKWKEGNRKWKDGQPSSYELDTGFLRIIVHRHISYEPDAWLVTCHNVGIVQKELKSKIVVAARNEAVGIVKRKLESMIESLK